MAKNDMGTTMEMLAYTHLEYSVVCRIFDEDYQRIAKPIAKHHYARDQLKSFLSAIGLDDNLDFGRVENNAALSYTDRTTPYRFLAKKVEDAKRNGKSSTISIPGFSINLVVNGPKLQQDPEFVRRVLETSNERFYFAHTLQDAKPTLQATGYVINERGRVVVKSGADVFRDYFPKGTIIHSRSTHRDCDDKMETVL